MFKPICSKRIATFKTGISVLGTFGLIMFSQPVGLVVAGPLPSLTLNMGKMADYGASPWYTEDIQVGLNRIKFSPDSGANFIWATSDLCNTDACNAHLKVNTSQPGFTWIDKCDRIRSFGPWGSMTTWTGEIPFTLAGSTPFFASVNYAGNKFEYLAWDGGIGFPSESDAVEEGSGFYFGSLYKTGKVGKPMFSFATYPESGKGVLCLGWEDTSMFNAGSAIELQPKKSTITYLWGTELYSAQMGDMEIPSLANACFFLDSGSSLFKGDGVYITPILEILYSIEVNGNRIFDKVTDDDGNWISLAYKDNKQPSDYPGLLPDFVLTMGQTCNCESGKSAKITLSPDQYSYKVEVGERAGSWVPAFTVLNGVGGFLVGSTFMDLFYTTHNYVDEGYRTGSGKLTQGNTYLHTKSSGQGPKALECVTTPATAPISGTWYNSFCSQVTLSAGPSGEISGVYTSHTGSTGSSSVVGWIGAGAPSKAGSDTPVNPKGIPVALGIQWRLINAAPESMDESWHWVSTFSGQYHPKQIVRQAGQKDYVLEETLEILNGLAATAFSSESAEQAPVFWPQTLVFKRFPPSYCEPIVPPTPQPFTGTATDNISGSWTNSNGDSLRLKADMQTGAVTGQYIENAGNKSFNVSGLADIISSGQPVNTKVVEQGVALTMIDVDGYTVLSMAGGVDLSNPQIMRLWKDSLSSTTWTGRYSESALDNVTWTRAQ